MHYFSSNEQKSEWESHSLASNDKLAVIKLTKVHSNNDMKGGSPRRPSLVDEDEDEKTGKEEEMNSEEPSTSNPLLLTITPVIKLHRLPVSVSGLSDTPVLVQDDKDELHCSFCSRSFHNRGSLKLHQRTHTNQCRICKKRFTTNAKVCVLCLLYTVAVLPRWPFYRGGHLKEIFTFGQ